MLAVRVRHGQHRALGGEEALDHGRGQSPPADPPQDPDLGEAVAQRLGHAPGAVRRVVVHHDDLVPDASKDLDHRAAPARGRFLASL